jgi:hypothetical protein
MLNINPGNEGYWDVGGDGRLIIAVTDLPGNVMRHCSWPLAFVPGEYEVDYPDYYGRDIRQTIMAYPRMIVKEPRFLLLRPDYWYEELFTQMTDLNLKAFMSVEPECTSWKPSGDSRWTNKPS